MFTELLQVFLFEFLDLGIVIHDVAWCFLELNYDCFFVNFAENNGELNETEFILEFTINNEFLLVKLSLNTAFIFLKNTENEF